MVSVEAAQNLVVVKTMPGLASAACSALDRMEIAGMVGSLAGDDTGCSSCGTAPRQRHFAAKPTSCWSEFETGQEGQRCFLCFTLRISRSSSGPISSSILASTL